MDWDHVVSSNDAMIRAAKQLQTSGQAGDFIIRYVLRSALEDAGPL
jgi:hypothetical protein